MPLYQAGYHPDTVASADQTGYHPAAVASAESKTNNDSSNKYRYTKSKYSEDLAVMIKAELVKD